MERSTPETAGTQREREPPDAGTLHVHVGISAQSVRRLFPGMQVHCLRRSDGGEGLQKTADALRREEGRLGWTGTMMRAAGRQDRETEMAVGLAFASRAGAGVTFAGPE